jgi:hypothetical protein
VINHEKHESHEKMIVILRRAKRVAESRKQAHSSVVPIRHFWMASSLSLLAMTPVFSLRSLG